VGSTARLVSLHAHSPETRVAACLGHLAAGVDLALCSDAGTPGVSDPGPALVRAAREAGFPVIPIPGPSAVATALSVTGWPADRYVFLGFPPRQGAARGAWLELIRTSSIPVVCFEAGNRVGRLLADLAGVCGDRDALIGREMTKKFEQYQTGTVAQLSGRIGDAALTGEVTLVVSGRRGAAPDRDDDADQAGDRAADLARALIAAGVERSRAARVLAGYLGLPRNASYRLAMEVTG
jgi:16S rRNA (cytidine1402-2'-O)-methyltransferase